VLGWTVESDLRELRCELGGEGLRAPEVTERLNNERILARHLPIQHSPNAQRIAVFQRIGQRAVWKSLITDQTREPENRLASYRRGPSI